MLTASLCLLAPQIAISADNESWFRYENDFFIAYSNAESRQARKILEDLEYFRAAALRIPNIVLPEDTQKTLVLIPATRAEYAAIAENENSIGFAQPLDGRTAIVFPATSRTDKSKYTLHHEYAHALSHVNSKDYPQWYSEGFAEIASSVVIHKRRKSFYVGIHEGRFWEVKEPLIDWNVLISDQFDAHAFDDVKVTASAYAQFWLLAHFLMLSGSAENLSNLENYFALLEKGQASNAAFEESFGLTANELWDTQLRDYIDRIPEYRHGFSKSSLDTSFDRSPAPLSEYSPILTFFQARATVARGVDQMRDPLSVIPGNWDELRFSDQCTEVLKFQLRDGADVLVMENFYATKSGIKVPGIFSLQHSYGSNLILKNITKARYPEIKVTPNYQLTVRSDDVLCFDELPTSTLCERVLHRCGR